MTRRPRWLIPSFAAAAGIILIAIPLFIPIGCNDAGPPPIQTIPQVDPEKLEVVEPPTAEQKKVALERIDRAIAAQGGEPQVRKLERHVEHHYGLTLTHVFGVILAAHEIKLQLPDRLRLKVDATAQDQHIVVAIERGDAWMAQQKMAQNVPGPVLASLTEELYYHRVKTLLPLKGKEFILQPIDQEEMVNGKPATAIRVGAKDHRTVNLYFDKATGLLVRTLHPGWIEAGQRQARDMIFLDYKEFDGVKMFSKYVDRRDGVVWFESTKESTYEFPKEIDPKEFARP